MDFLKRTLFSWKHPFATTTELAACNFAGFRIVIDTVILLHLVSGLGVRVAVEA